MKVKLKSIFKNIFLLEFQSNRQMASALLRFQEYYECREFRGKIFTVDEYKQWYISEYGAFTYYDDWDGFNFPNTALKPFFKGKFDPISEKEKEILGMFKGKRAPYYVIALAEKKDKTLLVEEFKHELAHALFHIDKQYRKEIISILSKYDISKIKNEIINMGDYCSSVIEDEIQAYILADPDQLKNKPSTKLMSSLNEAFERHMLINEL